MHLGDRGRRIDVADGVVDSDFIVRNFTTEGHHGCDPKIFGMVDYLGIVRTAPNEYQTKLILRFDGLSPIIQQEADGFLGTKKDFGSTTAELLAMIRETFGPVEKLAKVSMISSSLIEERVAVYLNRDLLILLVISFLVIIFPQERPHRAEFQTFR
jgi:hypothetical protein